MRCLNASKRQGIRMPLIFSDRGKLMENLLMRLKSGDVVFTLGAGDVWKLGEEILKRIKGRLMASKKQYIVDERLWQKMISQDSFSGEVKFMEPMKAHTYLQIGGPADVFVCPQDTVSLENILAALNQERIPFVTVGGGTNILVKDGGIYGAVISLKNFRRSDIVKEEKEMVMFFAESGTPLQKAC